MYGQAAYPSAKIIDFDVSGSYGTPLLAETNRDALERAFGIEGQGGPAAFGELLVGIGESVGRAHNAIVQHPVRPEAWGVCLRQQRNTFFDALLYKKHPKLYRERIRPVPPWDYYLIVVLALAVPVLGVAGSGTAAAACAAIACALVLRLAWRRLRGTAHTPAHVLEMLVTSALIPFLSVYWRVRGALRFRVLFL